MFRIMLITHHNVIKYFLCDLGGNYNCNKLYELLTTYGTIHQTSCNDTP